MTRNIIGNETIVGTSLPAENAEARGISTHALIPVVAISGTTAINFPEFAGLLSRGFEGGHAIPMFAVDVENGVPDGYELKGGSAHLVIANGSLLAPDRKTKGGPAIGIGVVMDLSSGAIFNIQNDSYAVDDYIVNQLDYVSP